MNLVAIVGNLTRDPELKYTSNQTAVCQVGVAVNERTKQGKKAHFFDVTLWGKTAELAGEYLHKGDRVGISGRLNHETWESDGQRRSKVSIVADKLDFLSAPREDQETAATASSNSREAPAFNDSECPF